MPTRNPLLGLPLDAVPHRSPHELMGKVGPVYPNWIRRNHSDVVAGQEGADDEYSLYTKLDGKLYRIYVGVRAGDPRYGVLLAVWRDRDNQTMMSIPWDVLADDYFSLPESRDAAAARIMLELATRVAAHDGRALRLWRTRHT